MPHILRRLPQQIKRNDLTLIVLETPVIPHLLQTNPHMGQFPVQAPSIAVVHVDQIGLAGAELTEDDHAWAGGVDCGAFVEEFVRGPGVADPDRWASAGPECDYGGLVLF